MATCYRCGRKGHHASKCFAHTGIDGSDLDDDDDDADDDAAADDDDDGPGFKRARYKNKNRYESSKRYCFR